MGVADVRLVEHRLRAAFPACPAADMERYCWLLGQPERKIAAQAIVVLEKPYGRNHVVGIDGTFGVSFACIEPGQGTSLHYHRRRREFFCVHSGTLTLLNANVVRVLGVGEGGVSVPFIPHSLRNDTGTTLRVLEMFSPAILDDKVRVDDRYHRTLGPVGVFE
jgi:mannose-6-phosphate isomerase-like protein (cupin superfamily)